MIRLNFRTAEADNTTKGTNNFDDILERRDLEITTKSSPPKMPMEEIITPNEDEMRKIGCETGHSSR